MRDRTDYRICAGAPGFNRCGNDFGKQDTHREYLLTLAVVFSYDSRRTAYGRQRQSVAPKMNQHIAFCLAQLM